MKRLFLATLVAASAQTAFAQNAAMPARSPGYENLGNFVGRWTLKGSEPDYLEVCDWYAGQFHVVCHTEQKRKDGSTGRGMSILSYLPEQGYVYTGIGSNGRYETLQHGTFGAGMFEFSSTAHEQGKSVATRIRIGPFTNEGFLFVVHTSTDGGAWTALDTINYIKIK